MRQTTQTCTVSSAIAPLAFAFSHIASTLEGAERSLVGLVEELVTDHGALCCVVVPGQGSLVQALERVGASCIITQYPWWCSLATEQLTEDERAQRLSQGIEFGLW